MMYPDLLRQEEAMRAAVYVRISRDAEGEALGVKRQEEDARALAERRGWETVRVFRDNDISAGGKRKRPGWEALLKAVETGEIDAIVAYSASRMYRRPADLYRLIELSKTRPLEIATVVSGEIDLNHADGRGVAGILAHVDQMELERVGERQRRKQKELKSNGFWTGGRVPFGYRPEEQEDPKGWKLVVFAPEAELIRKAAAAVLNGASLNSIARGWNAQGVTTTGGKPWRVGHVRMVLRRDSPGVLTSTDTRKLRKLLDDPKRTTSPRGGRYLLTGLLRCGHKGCDGRLVGRPQNGVRRYICTASGSVHLTIQAKALELYVARQGSLVTPGDLVSVQDPQQPLVAEAEAIRAQLKVLGQKYAEGDAFAEGAADKLRERLTEIETKLADPPEASESEMSFHAADLLMGLMRQGRTKSPERVHELLRETRPFIESLVDHITVAPGRGQGTVEERASIAWRPGVKRR